MTLRALILSLLLAGGLTASWMALTVPTEVQLPGTQPGEASLESATRCDNCHGGYDPAVEPAHGWHGSMMAQGSRDPLFWATVAVAERGFDGAGDLCLRCHLPIGWLEGRSTPTDGSAMLASDAEGVTCDLCHTMVKPDEQEWEGIQFPPFLAHDEGATPEGYYGSGMYVIRDGNEKLGPYDDPNAKHKALPSAFHRQSEFCGTCHDVSNPVTGDLAHNHGAQNPAGVGAFSGVLGDPVDTKAAFNNFPFLYGVVERTFSEHQSSAFANLLVSDYPTLPPELQEGSIEETYQAALVAGQGGDYEDGTPRYYSCQSCHMRPTTGAGCNKAGVRVRKDLPLHDLTGGNTWVPDALLYLDGVGKMQIGGSLTAAQIAGIQDGKDRARENLEDAAELEVTGNTARIVNLTGHKLITGFPEGRRMWLNVKWYDSQNALLREDGEYGDLSVVLDGQPTTVRTILDLDDPFLQIYEAEYGLTQEWANQLLALGVPASFPMEFDRLDGSVSYTLGDIAGQAAGTSHHSLHFVLNNTVIHDNRIPPYGMSYDLALERNCLPVPDSQYGGNGAGSTYLHYDDVVLSPPAGATFATIDLLYQPTSWEYVQFLYLANDGANAFLQDTGANLLEAWLMTGMAEPEVMASETWGSSGLPTWKVIGKP